jgi:hypothetical protein
MSGAEGGHHGQEEESQEEGQEVERKSRNAREKGPASVGPFFMKFVGWLSASETHRSRPS